MRPGSSTMPACVLAVLAAATPAGATTDPRGPATGTARINRGGGWHGHLIGDARAALRGADSPALRSNSVGFRCAAQAGLGRL